MLRTSTLDMLPKNKLSLLPIVKENGCWGIFVKSLGKQSFEFSMNEKTTFPTASTIKIFILIELFRQASEETLDLKQTVQIKDIYRVSGSGILSSLSDKTTMTLRDLAVLMMRLSDNTAANILIEKLGKKNINRTILRLGLLDTTLSADQINVEELEEKPHTLGITTPFDMASLFTALVEGRFLADSVCQEILNMMKKDQNQKRICGALPMRSDIVIYHKSGTLRGVYNDVGLITFNEGKFVICVLTKEIQLPEDPRVANVVEQTIASISRQVFDVLAH